MASSGNFMNPAMGYEKLCFLIASRIYQDMLSYTERMLQLSQSLYLSPFLTEVQTRRYLRTNRNASHLRHTEHFDTFAILGMGGFGRVELVNDKKNTSKVYALKTMYVDTDIKRANYHRIAQVERDVALLGHECPFIMKYKAVWMECNYDDRPDSFKFLMPVMEMGSLKIVIAQLHPYVTHDEPFTFCNIDELDISMNDPLHKIRKEMIALRLHDKVEKFRRIYARYMMQIFKGVTFLHQNGIAHHDIKPDNFLVDSNMDLKLSDYGLCSGKDYPQLFEFSYWAKPLWTHLFPQPSENQMLASFSPKTLRKKAKKWRNRERGVVEQPGTIWYKAPEQFIEWYERPSHQNRYFLTQTHYPMDWYAVGMTLFNLVLGRDIFKLCFDVFPDCTPKYFPNGLRMGFYDRLRFLKIHHRNNPFMMEHHDIQMVVPDLFVDVRFMTIIRSLLDSEPYQRHGESLFDNENVLGLADGVPLTGPSEWSFNEFYGGEFREPIAKVVSQYAGDIIAGRPTFIPPYETTALPQVASFSFMTGSPEIIATPKASPTKRMKLERG